MFSVLDEASTSIVDLHSHLGVDSAPYLLGSDDTNSLKGLVLPWLRSLDGLNTHDEAYKLSISGGVTTANVLPGSADAIGICPFRRQAARIYGSQQAVKRSLLNSALRQSVPHPLCYLSLPIA